MIDGTSTTLRIHGEDVRVSSGESLLPKEHYARLVVSDTGDPPPRKTDIFLDIPVGVLLDPKTLKSSDHLMIRLNSADLLIAVRRAVLGAHAG